MGLSSSKSSLLASALFSSSVFAQSIPESVYDSPLAYVTTYTQVVTPSITICQEGNPAHCIIPTVSVAPPVTQTVIGYIASASFCVDSLCHSGETAGTGEFLSIVQPQTPAVEGPMKSTAATAKSTAPFNNKPTQTKSASSVGRASTTAAPTISMSQFHNAAPVATAGAALAAAGAMGFAAALL